MPKPYSTDLRERAVEAVTLVAKQPDLTLKEILAAMAKQGNRRQSERAAAIL